jgi:adenylate cyclase
VPSIHQRTLAEQNSDRVRLTYLDQAPPLGIRRPTQLPATNSVDMNALAVMGLIAQIDLTALGTHAMTGHFAAASVLNQDSLLLKGIRMAKRLSLTALNLAGDEPGLTVEQRRWRREVRASWLRLAVFIILIANLFAQGAGGGSFLPLMISAYALATGISLIMALARRGPEWMVAAFVTVDASLVVALLHQHLLGPSGNLDHGLTASTLAIAFLLLNHVELRLKPDLVFLFSTIVLTGWLVVLGTFELYTGAGHFAHSAAFPILAAEGAIAITFAFAAFVGYLLTQDHNLLLKSVLRSERRRQNLSRFFSPKIVNELETKGATLGLERRDAAIVFVDLRSFTHFSEIASPEALGEMLSQYRRLVIDVVFSHGGTIDKFIGDGVMALFGQPNPSPDDAERALRCVIELREALAQWKEQRRSQRKEPLDAIVALHAGEVVGGVLRSGRHDEFTVFGDAVNVTERLERLAKVLGATLIVSADALSRVPGAGTLVPWIWQEAAALDGRTGTMKVAYLK